MVNTIPLVYIGTQDPRTDQKIADSQSTPYQISSPKFKHGSNPPGHEESEIREMTSTKNREDNSGSLPNDQDILIEIV